MKTRRRHFLGTLAAFSAGILSHGKLQAQEKSVALPTICELDVCVLGGSCTGVCAAVRAARLGAKTGIVERLNGFGGVATGGLVNVWHSLLDTEFKKQIIAGLTLEIVERLKKRDAVREKEKDESVGFTLNTAELKIELDELLLEAGVRPFLHTVFSEPYYENGKLVGAIVESKSGRGIIRAKQFVDATGDADLCARMGLSTYKSPNPQPSTLCAITTPLDFDMLRKLKNEHAAEFKLPSGFAWGECVPNTKGFNFMMSATRVDSSDISVADELTRAEIEGRRQIRALADMYKKNGGKGLGLVALPSSIGIREGRHIKSLHQITDAETMNGVRYEDAVANGSYRLDMHHDDKPGLTFMYLDGTYVYHPQTKPSEKGRWREKTDQNPTFYQIPMRSLIPVGTENIVVAGRMLDAQPTAFSGIRVMVNMNQLGEAAGTAAYLALQKNCAVKDVDAKDIRTELSRGGSIVI